MLYVHTRKESQTLLDKLVEASAFAYPMTGLPQVVLVFEGSTAGVSVPSWTAFFAFSCLFFVYGRAHRIKPMVTANLLWMGVDSVIVCGTLLRRMIT